MLCLFCVVYLLNIAIRVHSTRFLSFNESQKWHFEQSIDHGAFWDFEIQRRQYCMKISKAIFLVMSIDTTQILSMRLKSTISMHLLVYARYKAIWVRLSEIVRLYLSMTA